MLLEVWLALFAAGILTSIAAFVVRKAALYASLMNLFIWLTAAFGALNVEVVTESGEVVAFGEPAVMALALVNATVSLPVAYLAAVGKWGDETETGADSAVGRSGLDHPTRTGSMDSEPTARGDNLP
ncbi:hypothetical protein [Natrarchaeobaculum sulfurireducens]|uniref:Uncharacterized protein n=1 Tax=Natrarchaeobaculum sulfurireducens TaxID=2044521 RepID=A0A346PMG0_9EURY|nr:hypothetical protein [Natrarchaeobaculum sulfurireducens]AXR80705.1 hypothetical protein AArcMg_0683 [Natrarchaeobaculum sulfurireducens]